MCFTFSVNLTSFVIDAASETRLDTFKDKMKTSKDKMKVLQSNIIIKGVLKFAYRGFQKGCLFGMVVTT